jgi:hypothetical protein
VALKGKMRQYEGSKRLGVPELYLTNPFMGKKLGTIEDVGVDGAFKVWTDGDQVFVRA